MVPAILVFRPSVGKRVIVLMPDAPLVSLAQLSLLPAPSESSRQVRSRPQQAAPSCPYPPPSLLSSTNPFNVSETFATPMTHAGYDHLLQLSGQRPLQTG